jgi:hypothetical protein
VVVLTSSRYFRYEGVADGVGWDEGHVYYAMVRRATPEEKAGFW